MQITPWQDGLNSNFLSFGETRVWSAALDLENPEDFLPLLSEDEKSRAARLKSAPAARRQFVSRGILRVLLGCYLGAAPESLAFGISPHGKPFLTCPQNPPLAFNLAHSDGLLLVAIGGPEQVGIDVEKLDTAIDYSSIAGIMFCDEEQQNLSHSQTPIQDFYKLWTAKEAILKASGKGFAYPSDTFCVVISEEQVFIADYRAELAPGSSWSIASFSPASGYAAALAVLQ